MVPPPLFRCLSHGQCVAVVATEEEGAAMQTMQAAGKRRLLDSAGTRTSTSCSESRGRPSIPQASVIVAQYGKLQAVSLEQKPVTKGPTAQEEIRRRHVSQRVHSLQSSQRLQHGPRPPSKCCPQSPSWTATDWKQVPPPQISQHLGTSTVSPAPATPLLTSHGKSGSNSYTCGKPSTENC